VERLAQSDKVYCDRCRGFQEPLKQISFQTLPIILCIHLKASQLCYQSFFVFVSGVDCGAALSQSARQQHPGEAAPLCAVPARA
jgi:hypothetical protein